MSLWDDDIQAVPGEDFFSFLFYSFYSYSFSFFPSFFSKIPTLQTSYSVVVDSANYDETKQILISVCFCATIVRNA